MRSSIVAPLLPMKRPAPAVAASCHLYLPHLLGHSTAQQAQRALAAPPPHLPATHGFPRPLASWIACFPATCAAPTPPP